MKSKTLSIFSIFVIATSIVLPKIAFAVEDSSILTIAPARQEITVNPGEKTTLYLRFYNKQGVTVSGFLKNADFVVEDTQGSPKIIENPDQASPKFSASSWISLPYDRMSIPGNDKVSIPVTITVPEIARPGGRYVAVYFEPETVTPQAPVGSTSSGASTISPRIASLIYLRVAGPITESVIITKLFSMPFYEYGPITVESEIFNRGDYHVRPLGMITLYNMWGQAVASDKLSEQNIFPDTIRTFRNYMGQKWMFGRYRADISAIYGEKGQGLNRSIYVWAFPWRITIVVILALIILLVLLKTLYGNVINRQSSLESTVKEEKEEIERLKRELRNKPE